MSMTDETQVRDALHRATDELPAPVERLTQQATTRGRRRRARRRVAVAAASLCAVAAIAAPVVATLGPDTAREAEFTSGPSIGAQAPVVSGGESSGESGWWDMPQTEMLAALQTRLPMGMQTTDMLGEPPRWVASPPSEGFRGWLQNALTKDGQLVGFINVSLASPDLAPGWDPTCSGEGTAGGLDCQVVTDEQGKPIGSVSSGLDHAFKVRWVTIARPDGGVVTIASGNCADWKTDPNCTTYGDAPPLTRDELVDIATDPVWTSFVPG